MDARRLVLIGGGGHASVLLDVLQTSPAFIVEGYLAPERGPLSKAGVRHLGDDRRLADLMRDGISLAVLGVAGAAQNARRRDLFLAWVEAGFEFPPVVHPSAAVSRRADVGPGLQCLAGAVVNAGACLGANVIINSNATVEHDCRLGDHVHIAPGATLCGGVEVGAGTLIGAGAVVVPGVRIGRDVLVAAGAVVVRDLPDGSRVAGVPARDLGARS